jgi:membrane protease subunit HflK
MPWNNQGGGGWQGSGGGGGGRGPWGQPPQGGGPRGPRGNGNQPPNLEDIIKQGQDRFRKVMPGGGRLGGGGLIIGLLILVAVWLASGIYRVGVEEQGVVTRFGAFQELKPPGLHYHLPWPIEAVQTPKVTVERSTDVGFRDLSGDRRQNVERESLMLAGDENVVDVQFTILWVINDAAKYLFNIQNQEESVKSVAEAAMREIVGRSNLEAVLTQRAQIEVQVRDLMQEVLNSYDAGITINQVQMQRVDPPSQVIEAFRDVQAARQDQERLRNQAEAYANRVIPEARGEAERILQEAEAYREQTVAQAQGDAQRFLAIYEQYALAPHVTRQRMFLETMEHVMKGSNKMILDMRSGQNLVPYLPLDQLQRAQPRATQREGGR